MCKFMTKGLCLFLFLALGLAPGSVGAEEEPVWPVKSDLIYKDGDLADLWHDAGIDVGIKNSKFDLTITIDPGEDLGIEEVGIHIVNDPDDFSSDPRQEGQAENEGLRLPGPDPRGYRRTRWQL